MDREPSHDQLCAIIERISPTERALLQLLAVIYEPCSKTILHRCAQACSLEPFAGFRSRSSSPEDLTYYLTHLRKLHLIDAQLRCQPTILEPTVRQAIAAGSFEALAKAVRQILPFESVSRANSPSACLRHVRELRIAFHSQDAQLFNRCYAWIHEHCPDGETSPEPVVDICNHPFDEEWFSRLPIEWQIFSLDCIFSSATWHLTDDQMALSYGLKTEFQQLLPDRARAKFDFDLTLRCLAGGELAEARRLLATSPARADFLGLSGLLAFQEGGYDQAAANLAKDLRELRHRARKRNACFQTLPGVAYALAVLLGSQRPDMIKLRQ
ncbi:MAG TPA: hypothetical protein DCZ69_01550, partial [Syntrophobacteraceae bacterium]|nr:hypothetical protein [Syntrophobacteraceae bacterium]